MGRHAEAIEVADAALIGVGDEQASGGSNRCRLAEAFIPAPHTSEMKETPLDISGVHPVLTSAMGDPGFMCSPSSVRSAIHHW